MSFSPRQFILGLLPRRFRFALRYMVSHQRFSLLLFPRRFSEKLMLRIAIDRRPILRQMADKMTMRAYISEKVGEEFLPRLLWSSRNPEELDLENLPDKFVLKASHGSGFIRLVPDKSAVCREELIALCHQWILFDYGKYSREQAYVGLEPTIMIEEFLVGPGTDGNIVLPDYKFWVFEGKCSMVQVDYDRFGDHRRNLHRPDWTQIHPSFKYPSTEHAVEMPPQFSTLLAFAERLGGQIDFVRVDLYDTDRGPVVGELTMTPLGGVQPFSRSFDIEFGRYWKQVLR